MKDTTPVWARIEKKKREELKAKAALIGLSMSAYIRGLIYRDLMEGKK